MSDTATVDGDGVEPERGLLEREPKEASAISRRGPEGQGGYVLDASALLCLMNDEPGAERVATVLSRAVVSTVNLAEVATKLNELGAKAEEGRRRPGLHPTGAAAERRTAKKGFVASRGMASTDRGRKLGAAVATRGRGAAGLRSDQPIDEAVRVAGAGPESSGET